ncbi:hypothetical protein [Sporosarcina trichiuri]|uniref:hypothetical protein n=1 Tax=Sporosarcina trichiuri TaxID=3056445 RepID=UPI0025B46A9E|nr:hypothetical protein [Sporosarcina sp. 0.2-SM1T-5]WJY27291.1 hypothetical protein QWT68_14815 [Sporosarcina sp. 0.2-SM1T-5]
MTEKQAAKHAEWRETYGPFAVALGCLYTATRNWGTHWGWTVFFGFGVIICGTMGFFTIRSAWRKKKGRAS